MKKRHKFSEIIPANRHWILTKEKNGGMMWIPTNNKAEFYFKDDTN